MGGGFLLPILNLLDMGAGAASTGLVVTPSPIYIRCWAVGPTVTIGPEVPTVPCDCDTAAHMTPQPSCQPFALADDLFVYHDPNEIADMVRVATDPRPTASSMANINTQYGQIVYRHLMRATGRIMAEAQVGKRYQPCDLLALVSKEGNNGFIASGGELVIQMTADIAYWSIIQRKRPMASNPENVPGVKETFELLKALSKGEAIFSFVETANAGLPDVSQAIPDMLQTPNVILRARRVFGNYGMNNLPNNPAYS